MDWLLIPRQGDKVLLESCILFRNALKHMIDLRGMEPVRRVQEEEFKLQIANDNRVQSALEWKARYPHTGFVFVVCIVSRRDCEAIYQFVACSQGLRSNIYTA